MTITTYYQRNCAFQSKHFTNLKANANFHLTRSSLKDNPRDRRCTPDVYFIWPQPPFRKVGNVFFFLQNYFLLCTLSGCGSGNNFAQQRKVPERTTEEKTLLRRVRQGESSSSPWQQKNNMLWWGAECPPEQWKCSVCASTKVIGAEIRVRPERQHSLINRPSLNFQLQRVILKWWGDIIWKQKDNKDKGIWRTALNSGGW